MCKFCENEQEIKTDTGHWHIAFWERYGMYYRHRECKNSCGIEIFYCPLCGRKLSEETENFEFKGKIYVHNEYGNFGLDEINNEYMKCRETMDEYNKRFKEQKAKISELESELAKKETLLKIREDWCEECKEKSAVEKLKQTPLFEEPLPFSDEEETKTELPTMPIDVASMLINARTGLRDKYSKDDLREITEHLRAFIVNPSDD